MLALTQPQKEVSPRHPLLPQRRILLVDQEARDRERYTRHLRERGLSVRACATYEEGRQALQCESYDLVIVDQGGPAFEGKVIAALSRQKNPRVPVLVITRHHQMASYVEAMQLGAAEYLEKPIPIHELLWRVGTYLPTEWVTKQAS